MKQEYLGPQSANYAQDSCRTLCWLPISHHPEKARQWETEKDLEPNTSHNTLLSTGTFSTLQTTYTQYQFSGERSQRMCHVDRTIGWLNFSFFNLLLCCQTQLQCKVLAAGRRFHFSNLSSYFLFPSYPLHHFIFIHSTCRHVTYCIFYFPVYCPLSPPKHTLRM